MCSIIRCRLKYLLFTVFKDNRVERKLKVPILRKMMMLEQIQFNFELSPFIKMKDNKSYSLSATAKYFTLFIHPFWTISKMNDS